MKALVYGVPPEPFDVPGNANALTQTMTADLGDVDPTDDKVHVRFAIAPVLENPGASHAYTEQPYYFVRLENLTRGTTLYQDFNAANQPGVPWKNFTSSRLRPAACARSRVSSMTLRAPSGETALMNTPSACRAAKARPAEDVPAWKITGVRCGDGKLRCGPSTR